MIDIIKQMKEQQKSLRNEANYLLIEAAKKELAANKLDEVIKALEGNSKDTLKSVEKEIIQRKKRKYRHKTRDLSSPIVGQFGTRLSHMNQILHDHMLNKRPFSHAEICDFLCRQGILKAGRTINLGGYMNRKLFTKLPNKAWQAVGAV